MNMDTHDGCKGGFNNLVISQPLWCGGVVELL